MLASRGFSILGAFGVAILTARMLGPADRGHYYYVITLAGLAVQLASLGIHSSNTYLIARAPTLLAQIMANTAWIAVVGGVIAAAGVMAVDFAFDASTPSYVLIAVVLVLAPSLLFFMYLSNMATALNRPRTYNGLVIFNSVASIAMALIALYPSPSIHRFLYATVATAVLSCVVGWTVLARGIAVPRKFDYPLFSRGIAFALRAHIATLFGFLMARMGVMVIREFGNFSDLGYWSIAAQLCDALLVLPATIGLLLFPSLVRAEGVMRWNEFKTALLQLGSVMALLCIAAAGATPLVVRIMFGVTYAPAVAIVTALLPGVFFLGVASVASQFLAASGYPWSQVMAWIFGSLLQAGLSFALFGQFGVIGLAWTQSGCAGLVCVYLLANTRKYSSRHLEGVTDP
jgi:O-antigen/teichoic acid export membrane protein